MDIAYKKNKAITKMKYIFWALIFIGVFLELIFLSSKSFAGSQQTSATLASTIITNARMYLNDTTATYFHSDAEMLVYLNNGTMDIVTRSHCLVTRIEKELQLDVSSYPITMPFIAIGGVIYRNIDEKITNGTMEADSSWSDEGTPAANAQSSTQAYEGIYSRKFTPNAADEGIRSAVYTTVTGTTYYYSLFVYPDDEESVNIYIKKGDNSGAIVDLDVTGLTENYWNVISGSYTETVGGALAKFSVRSPTGITAGDWYVDEVSVYTSASSKALRRGAFEHIGDIDPVAGEPAYFTEWGSNAYVYPRPDSDAAGKVIQIYVVTRPVDVLAAAAVLVPAHFDRALTLYIVAQALKKDAKYAQSNAVIAEYQAEIDRYRQDFHKHRTKEDVN